LELRALKILILKPSSLGDVVQALPVLRLLKLHWPQSEIFWWIDSSLAPLLEGDPDLAGVVRFERRRWASPAYWPEMWRSIHWMRAQNFDLVIDIQCLSRSGMFAWLANGKFLIGLDDPREGARGFYDVIARRPSYHTHAVDWYLEVLKLLGVPVHWNFNWLPERREISAKVKQQMDTFVATAGGPYRPERELSPTRSAPHLTPDTPHFAPAVWIILQPGARWLNKRWPVENFAALAGQLSKTRPNVRFAILGGESDRELGAAIAKADSSRCLDLTGKISLPEMVEWIRLSDLMISNDTGPMHVAAALGKPVVAIFGPTEPRRTGPYRPERELSPTRGTRLTPDIPHLAPNVIQTKLPCVPCMKPWCANPKQLECLHTIAPAQAASLAEKLLSARM